MHRDGQFFQRWSHIIMYLVTLIFNIKSYFTDNIISTHSTVAVGVITFAVTFILTIAVTAIITFIVTYFCVKRKFEKLMIIMITISRSNQHKIKHYMNK